MNNLVKIGDKVNWRGGFGANDPKVVEVTSIEVTDLPRDKYGEIVGEVTWDLVKENRVNFGLSSGNWAYSEQVAPVGQGPRDFHGIGSTSMWDRVKHSDS